MNNNQEETHNFGIVIKCVNSINIYNVKYKYNVKKNRCASLIVPTFVTFLLCMVGFGILSLGYNLFLYL